MIRVHDRVALDDDAASPAARAWSASPSIMSEDARAQVTGRDEQLAVVGLPGDAGEAR